MTRTLPRIILTVSLVMSGIGDFQQRAWGQAPAGPPPTNRSPLFAPPSLPNTPNVGTQNPYPGAQPAPRYGQAAPGTPAPGYQVAPQYPPAQQYAPRAQQLPAPQPQAYPPYQQPPPEPRTARALNPVEGEIFEGSMIIAQIGGEIVLADDVLRRVDLLMEKNRDKIPPLHWEEQRWQLVQQSLKNLIEIKLVLNDAKRTIPAERLPAVQEQVNEQFEKSRLSQLMEEHKVSSRADLELALRKKSSSINEQKSIYFERSLVAQWMHQQTRSDKKIQHEELLEYYHANLTKFDRPGRAKWEHLQVDFSKFASKAEAHAKIAQMGNDVLRGISLEQVARAHSHGLTAKGGGSRDWTTQGSLTAESVNEALFGLPLGQMSTILEGPNGFHIIRVTEREVAHREPFDLAQESIRETIEDERSEKATIEYQERLQREIHVWTIFDDPAFMKSIAEKSTSLQ